MIDDRGFQHAMESLRRADSPRASLCDPFVSALPISGAAISLLSTGFGTETVCASDRQAARLDELQIDYGIGPCWDAMAQNRPVSQPDLRSAPASLWPPLLHEIRDDGVRALYAFPLSIGALDLGAVDLYSLHPGELTRTEVHRAEALASEAARQVLRRVVDRESAAQRDDDDPEVGDGGAQEKQILHLELAAESGFSRREVHQATGMVLAQMNVSAEDALLVLRGHAYAEGRPLREIARDVVERRLSFGPPPTHRGLD